MDDCMCRDRVGVREIRRISMVNKPMRGKLRDRLISTFESQDIKYDLLGFTVRLVSAENAGG